jgi:hypothetical protein
MADRVGVVSMFVNGLKVVLFSLPLMGPLLLLNGLCFGFLDHQLAGLIPEILDKNNPNLATGISQCAGFLAVLLGLYTILQIKKRETASRVSWIPCLFLPSCLIVAALVASPNELIVSLVLRISMELTWMCTVGGLIYGLWVCLSYSMATTGRVNIRASVNHLRAQGLGFLAPHGGATLLIYLGMQVLIPGIFYAVMYAFVDHAALLKPKESAFQNSTETSKGLRRPIMLLFTATLVPAIVGRIYLTVWAEKMFHTVGLSDAFVKNGVYDAGAAWNNVMAMFFGAPWAGAFYSEGVAMALASLMTGIAASGLTWAYLARQDVERVV